MFCSGSLSTLIISAYYSDECFQSIQQLRTIKKETEELLSDPSKQPDGDTDGKPAAEDESKRRRSSNDLAAVAPTPELASANTAETTIADSSRSTPSLSPESVVSPTPLVIPEKDALLGEYDLLLDEEVAFRYEVLENPFQHLYKLTGEFLCLQCGDCVLEVTRTYAT